MIEDYIEQPKQVWTTEDYEDMGWHDSVIYGINFHPEHDHIKFDIDYCLGHVPINDVSFKQCTAACDLVFHDPSELSLNLQQTPFPLEIEDLYLSYNGTYPSGSDRWAVRIVTRWGEISFKATGFTQTLTSKLVVGCRDY